VPGERLNRHILENTAGLDAIFRSSALDNCAKVLDHQRRLSHGLFRASG
jgi:hypothetical protein